MKMGVLIFYILYLILFCQYIVGNYSFRKFSYYLIILSLFLFLFIGFCFFKSPNEKSFVYFARLIGIFFSLLAISRTYYIQKSIQDEIETIQTSYFDNNIGLVSKVVTKTETFLLNLDFQRAYDISDALEFFINDCCSKVGPNPKLHKVMLKLQKDYSRFRSELNNARNDQSLINHEQSIKLNRKLNQILLRLNSRYEK